MNDSTAVDAARALGEALSRAGLKIATAESCTGGLISAAITEIPGCSGWFERGAVVYSNDAKHDFLDVPENIFEQDGAVSEACARAMAEGLIGHSRADLAISVTGIAGPDGGSVDKPVGTVWFGVADHRATDAITRLFSGDRAAVRAQAAHFALEFALQFLTRSDRVG